MTGRGTVEARVGGDLFTLARAGGIRRSGEAPPSLGPSRDTSRPLPDSPATPHADPLAEYRHHDALFAFALSQETGWVAVRAATALPGDRPRHAVLAPDGVLWDADGPRGDNPPDLFGGLEEERFLPCALEGRVAATYPPETVARARRAASRMHRSRSGAGTGPPARPAGAAPCGPATDRQLGFASDISKALRVPLPESRDSESISAFIALHRHGLKGNRGRP